VVTAAFNNLLYMQPPHSLLEKKAKSTAPSCNARYFSVLVPSASGTLSITPRRTCAAAAVVAWSAGVVMVVAATVPLPYLRVTLSLLAQYY
jgi:hypothetical protein